jgi:hypothetical protein
MQPSACVVTAGPLVAVFFIMYRLASLEMSGWLLTLYLELDVT